MNQLLSVISLAQKAGEAILALDSAKLLRLKLNEYRGTLEESPVTEADLVAHEILAEGLQKILNIPVISEEDVLAQESGFKLPEDRNYWLIDPIDGTRHYLKGDGEYAVLVALVEDGVPTLGVVHAPAKALTFWAEKGQGAYCNGEKIFNHRSNTSGLIAFSSGYHQKPRGRRFIELLDIQTIITYGSALKLCFIAQGDADLYPRFGPTYEWDTAAAQVILEEAGGEVLDPATAETLLYGKDQLLNHGFIAARKGIDFKAVFKQLESEAK